MSDPDMRTAYDLEQRNKIASVARDIKDDEALYKFCTSKPSVVEYCKNDEILSTRMDNIEKVMDGKKKFSKSLENVLTYNKDADKKTAQSLDNLDLATFCSTNAYTRKLCSEDSGLAARTKNVSSNNEMRAQSLITELELSGNTSVDKEKLKTLSRPDRALVCDYDPYSKTLCQQEDEKPPIIQHHICKTCGRPPQSRARDVHIMPHSPIRSRNAERSSIRPRSPSPFSSRRLINEDFDENVDRVPRRSRSPSPWNSRRLTIDNTDENIERIPIRSRSPSPWNSRRQMNADFERVPTRSRSPSPWNSRRQMNVDVERVPIRSRSPSPWNSRRQMNVETGDNNATIYSNSYNEKLNESVKTWRENESKSPLRQRLDEWQKSQINKD